MGVPIYVCQGPSSLGSQAKGGGLQKMTVNSKREKLLLHYLQNMLPRGEEMVRFLK